jgi:aspartyl protease/tetratricopeptide repeat protein
VSRARRPRRHAAAWFLLLIATLAWPAFGQTPPAQRVAIELPTLALARLDSLQGIVRAEEARARRGPGVEVNWDRLARAWFQVGDHGRAARSLEHARALGAREFDTALLSGRVARSEGRFDEAVEWLTRAAHMRPDDWEAHEDLGLALYLAGRLPAAADHWERARALPGSGAPARAGLLEAMREAGDDAYRVSGRGRERLRFVPEIMRGAMVVPVRIDGRGPFLFRIDTGSPEVVLGRSLADELGIVTLAGGETGATVGSRPVRFDYAALDSLTLGETTLHGLPVAVSDHPGLGSPQGVRGTLGFEALRRFRFCLDLPDSALWLEPLVTSGAAADSTPPAWAAGSVSHRLPLLLRGTHLLVVYARVNDGPERPFLLDTGGPGIGLSAPISTLAEAGITIDTTQTHTGTSAAGTVGYLRFTVAHLCVDGACGDSLEGVYGIFPARLELNPNFRVAGLISNGFFSRYRVGVDLARREVWLVEP